MKTEKRKEKKKNTIASHLSWCEEMEHVNCVITHGNRHCKRRDFEHGGSGQVAYESEEKIETKRK